MADNVPITAGSGTTIAADEIIDGTLGTVKVQYVKLMDGTLDSTTKIGGSVGLPITQLDIAATGSITTQNLVPAGTATAGSAVLTGNLTGISGAAIQVTGTYTGALSIQGTVDNATWVTLGGTPFLNVNTGVYSATIPSAATGIYQVDIAGFKQARVTGLAAMTGTAVVSIQASNGAGMVALDAPLPTGANIIGALSANQSENIAQINGVTPLMGNGVTGTGSLRVTLASDTTSNTNPLLTRLSAQATGGATTFTLISAATTNATNVKASAGTLYSLSLSNNGASAAYVKLFNLAVAPTVGTSVATQTFLVPAGGGREVTIPPMGWNFGTGIAYCITALGTTADTTAVAAAQVFINGSYT